jgi:hypothetical protein
VKERERERERESVRGKPNQSTGIQVTPNANGATTLRITSFCITTLRITFKNTTLSMMAPDTK